MGRVIQMPARPANDVPSKAPPFDPANPLHARAWQIIWEMGMSANA